MGRPRGQSGLRRQSGLRPGQSGLRPGSRRRTLSVVAGAVFFGLFILSGTATPAGATAATPAPSTARAIASAVRTEPAGDLLRPPGVATGDRPHDSPEPTCTFNGSEVLVPGVTAGAAISVACNGWAPDDQIEAAEFSPLVVTSESSDDIDANLQDFTADDSGHLDATFFVPDPFTASDPQAACPPTTAQIAEGYQRCGIGLVDTDGNTVVVALDYVGVSVPAPSPSPFGPVPAPVGAAAVGIASTPYGGGYWLAWSNGSVTGHGDALDFGDASNADLAQPITHIVGTPDGLGYWLVAADGGVFTYGDAPFYGSMGGKPLDQPVVDMAPTPDGRGYWLVASDGGVFTYGNAGFYGSMGGKHLNQPVVGIAADTATGGYWLVASDGGVFAFDAPFIGSTGNAVLDKPVVGMAAVPGGAGYLIVASDGGVFTYGDARFDGSTGGTTLAAPVVGVTLDPETGGYWLAAADGGVFAFDAPFDGSD